MLLITCYLKSRCLLLSIFAMCCLSVVNVARTSELQTSRHIVFIGSIPPNTPKAQWVIDVHAKTFERLGYTFEYRVCRISRCNIESSSLNVAGELMRPTSYSRHTELMTPVDVPYSVSSYSAYTVRDDLQVTSWQDIIDQELKVEVFRGASLAQERLAPLASKQLVHEVSDYNQAYEKLLAGRSDIFIGITAQSDRVSASKPTRYQSIQRIATLEEMAIVSFIKTPLLGMMPELASTLREVTTAMPYEQYQPRRQHPATMTPMYEPVSVARTLDLAPAPESMMAQRPEEM